jgi:hypothetical protein
MLDNLEKEGVKMILESIKVSFIEEEWDNAVFIINYAYNLENPPIHTGAGMRFDVFDKNDKWIYHDFLEIIDLKKMYDPFFLLMIEIPEKKFNTVKLKVFVDGRYEATYFWDEEEIKADRALGMKFFPEGLSESIRTIMYDSKQFGIKKPTWVSGEQQIRVRDGQVSISTHTVNEQGKKKNFKVEIPEELAKGILDFHEATAEGDFKDQYPKWNLIRIQMDVRYYSKAEKDVTFEWEA